jgi:hypothetical protein
MVLILSGAPELVEGAKSKDAPVRSKPECALAAARVRLTLPGANPT